MRNIAWDRVDGRHRRVVAEGQATLPVGRPDEISAETLRDMIARHDDIIVLDLRLADDFTKGADMLPTAEHRPGDEVERWAAGLPKNRPIVGYCVYGFQVSRDPVAVLRKQGYDARTLAGGIATWRAIGAPTVSKTEEGAP
jgi:Fe-Mn family superoxide dismutase